MNSHVDPFIRSSDSWPWGKLFVGAVLVGIAFAIDGAIYRYNELIRYQQLQQDLYILAGSRIAIEPAIRSRYVIEIERLMDENRAGQTQQQKVAIDELSWLNRYVEHAAPYAREAERSFELGLTEFERFSQELGALQKRNLKLGWHAMVMFEKRRALFDEYQGRIFGTGMNHDVVRGKLQAIQKFTGRHPQAFVGKGMEWIMNDDVVLAGSHDRTLTPFQTVWMSSKIIFDQARMQPYWMAVWNDQCEEAAALAKNEANRERMDTVMGLERRERIVAFSLQYCHELAQSKSKSL